MIKLIDLLNEGVFDKGILKAVFLAGGPGSGKTYAARGLFGLPKKINLSYTGLKMVNYDSEFEKALNKFGFGTELDAMPDEVFADLTGFDKKTDQPVKGVHSGLRNYTKELTKERQRLYENGRLGMIIDGTGDDYAKIADNKSRLEEIGYDCYMVFINTSMEIALHRNNTRKRVLPKKLVTDSWHACQKNIGRFQGLFKGNIVVVDNSKHLEEDDAKKKFDSLAKTYIDKFVKKPTKNPKGKNWIRHQKILKKRK